ncbi:MAG: hypothetical protein WCO10_02290 [bacterium]
MSRRETKFYLKAIIISFFVLILLGYGIYEAWNLMTGPTIDISSPQNGITVSESLISIAGVARNINEIKMNDRPISIDEQGNFSEEMLLSYGYNIITLRAKDRFGKEVEKKLELIYK